MTVDTIDMHEDHHETTSVPADSKLVKASYETDTDHREVSAITSLVYDDEYSDDGYEDYSDDAFD